MSNKAIIIFTALIFIISFQVASQCDNNSFQYNEKQIKKIKEKGIKKPQSKYCVVEISVDTLISGDRTIEGAVYDRITREPLSYTNISVFDTIGTTAKENGTFEFKAPAGKYRIKFFRVGYPTFYTKKINIKRNSIIRILVFLEEDLI